MENIALISDIQRYSINDGPGIRTTVFFVGCPLRCKWCSNPELIEMRKKTLEFRNGDEIEYKVVGEEYTVANLVTEIKKDKIFYEESGGGVTLSGGEPGLYSEFIVDLCQALEKENINVAIDTSAMVSNESFRKILQYVDLVLLDIKTIDESAHKIGTGQSNRLILENAKMIKDYNVDLIVRLVIVPGYTDDENDLKARIDFAQSLGANRIDILRYHELGVGKYQGLGIDYELRRNLKVDEKTLDFAFNYCKEKGIIAYVK